MYSLSDKPRVVLRASHRTGDHDINLYIKLDLLIQVDAGFQDTISLYLVRLNPAQVTRFINDSTSWSREHTKRASTASPQSDKTRIIYELSELAADTYTVRQNSN